MDGVAIGSRPHARATHVLKPAGLFPTPVPASLTAWPLLVAPQVPTLRSISEDMDKVKLGSNAAPGKEIYDTGLAPYVQWMDRFLSRLGDAARAEKVREITANKQSSLDF